MNLRNYIASVIANLIQTTKDIATHNGTCSENGVA